MTITLASLAAAAARCSASVVTATDQNVNDYRITLTSALTTGTPGASKAVFVWVTTSNDGGTTWDGNSTGTNAAITLDSPHQFNLGCVIPIGAQSLTRSRSFSLKAACEGSLPNHWAIIVENQTGIAFAASGQSLYYKEEYNS
jgi:hypothetical protein